MAKSNPTSNPTANPIPVNAVAVNRSGALIRVGLHSTFGLPLAGLAGTSSFITGVAFSIFAILFAGLANEDIKKGGISKTILDKLTGASDYSFNSSKEAVEFEWKYLQKAIQEVAGVVGSEHHAEAAKIAEVAKKATDWNSFKKDLKEERKDNATDTLSGIEQQYSNQR